MGMKNITLSAPEALIEAARSRAQQKGTTLNEEFRKWLAEMDKADQQARLKKYKALLKQLHGEGVDLKGPYTREEMNER